MRLVIQRTVHFLKVRPLLLLQVAAWQLLGLCAGSLLTALELSLHSLEVGAKRLLVGVGALARLLLYVALHPLKEGADRLRLRVGSWLHIGSWLLAAL